jgi:hypothetical protein
MLERDPANSPASTELGDRSGSLTAYAPAAPFPRGIGLEANRGFINLILRRLKVIFSNRKIKEKNREYARML